VKDANSHIDLSEPVGPRDHVLGPERAAVTIVEYGDFECPTCKQAMPAVKMMLRRFEGRVRFAFRHFPVEDAHPHALLAAVAAECAAAQGQFWAMHDLLFDNQAHLETEDLHRYGMHLGLDTTAYAAALDDPAHVQRVRADLASGKRSGLRATPGFFIDGKIQDVSFGLRSLVEATEAALEAR
jgi:protein-disulfide isomerase